MTSLGLTPFRSALAFEIFGNLVTLPTVLFNPNAGLAILAQDASQVTPATRSLLQWFGGLVAFLTVPLVLSWPNPKAPNDAQVGFRRATYITLGAGEVVLGALLAWQYLSGTSGLKGGAVLFMTGNMAALLVMRWIFLVAKTEWLEGVGSTKKTK